MSGDSDTLHDLIDDEAEHAEADRGDPIPAASGGTRPNRSKSGMLSLRLNPDELKAVQELARQREVPASALVRGWILQRLATRRAPPPTPRRSSSGSRLMSAHCADWWRPDHSPRHRVPLVVGGAARESRRRSTLRPRDTASQGRPRRPQPRSAPVLSSIHSGVMLSQSGRTRTGIVWHQGAPIGKFGVPDQRRWHQSILSGNPSDFLTHRRSQVRTPPRPPS